MDNQGFIFLHRRFLDWEWYGEPNMVALFIHILLSANYEAKRWKGIEIERGQFITSLQSLSDAIGVSVMKVRTCLKRLEETGEITTKTTNKYSVITICKYDSYQSQNSDANKQITNNQQTDNKQITIKQQSNNNNIINKEINNNNNIYSLSNEREYETEKVEAIEEKPKAKTKGKKKDPDPYFAPLKETFMNFYSLMFNSEYYWEAKDSVAIKAISKKLQKAAKDKGLDDTPENIATNFGILLNNISDKWILDHMAPTLINSKYNEIISTIKQKKHGNSENIRISFAPVPGHGANEATASDIDTETDALAAWCKKRGFS